MDQICLRSTIWWPPLWFRKPSSQINKEKRFPTPTLGFAPILALPLSSSGWCLSPVSLLHGAVRKSWQKHDNSNMFPTHYLHIYCQTPGDELALCPCTAPTAVTGAAGLVHCAAAIRNDFKSTRLVSLLWFSFGYVDFDQSKNYMRHGL